MHYYQRPDAGLPLDSNRTVLGGDAEEVKFGKVGGQHLMFETAYQRRSAGFEINDLGYLRRADQQSWSTWVGFFDRRERAFYKRLQLNNNWWQYWTTAGLPQEAAYNTNMHITLKNDWGVHMGGTVGQLGTHVRRSRGARRSGGAPGCVHRAVDAASTATTGTRSCRRCGSTTGAATADAVRRSI